MVQPSTAVAEDRVWHAEKGFRWTTLTPELEGKPGFTLLSGEVTGINFTNHLDELTAASNRVLVDGSGVAAGDIDNDGRPDLFFASLDGNCRLYRNLGNWNFKDVTADSGVDCSHSICRGAVFADINGDGWLDLLVSTCGQGVRCFLNEGQGHFKEVTETVGTASSHGSLTLALADIDGN
jgi:hypothetical protein